MPDKGGPEWYFGDRLNKHTNQHDIYQTINEGWYEFINL